ncbi:MAG: endopeptidase La [Planctomycetota bacterium]
MSTDEPGLPEPPEAETKHAVMKADDSLPGTLFVLPARDAIIFPGLMMPVRIPEGWELESFQKAQSQHPTIAIVPLKDPHIETPGTVDYHRFGVAARIVQSVKLPGGDMKAVLQGQKRIRIQRFVRRRPPIARVSYPVEVFKPDKHLEALQRVVESHLRELIEGSPMFDEEFNIVLANIESASHLADLAASYFVKKREERIAALESLDVRQRLEIVADELVREVELLQIGQKIQDQIREKIEQHQKEFYLREQLKVIRQELGEEVDRRQQEIDEYREKIEAAGMNEIALERALEELERFSVIPSESPESTVVRNYLDWLLAVPWSETTEDDTDIDHARKILARDHYGLEEIKTRILEFLAVRKLSPEHRGPVVCFVGPPGVGKTSLGRSIASALGRRFVRFSLGGMRDEAEIKGHRRTYIGAMPGRIVQSLKVAGTLNPVFMLDEIDKIGADFRGDPASALLEVLDPEQNHAFSDHYLDVPVDLSKILFVATANVLDTIPPPLRDRMEVIELSGYMPEEKFHIARRYLLPRQIENHGLTKKQLTIDAPALRRLISRYTREAGVRNLEQKIARLCRKVAAQRAEGKRRSVKITKQNLSDYLGPEPIYDEVQQRTKEAGVALGLAWTPVGGDVLFIESARSPGKGSFALTGSLGQVMQESANIAMTYLKAHAEPFGLEHAQIQNHDFHVHFPAGAIPKDGPSAGITIVTSLLSLLLDRPLRSRLAMTGEISLTGRVLPVGGIREKVLAAKRYGVKEIVLPALNQKDVDEIPEGLRSGLTFHFVDDYPEVFELVFRRSSRTKKKSTTSRRNGRKAARRR